MIRVWWFSFLLAAAVSRTAHAGIPFKPDTTVDAWAGAGFEHTWAVSVGGAYVLPHALRLSLQYSTLLVAPVYKGGDVSLALSHLFFRSEWFALGAQIALATPYAIDSTGAWLSFDTAVALAPGIYRRNFVLALDLAVRWSWLAWLQPSAPVAALFGDRPKGSPSASASVVRSFPGLRLLFGATSRWTIVRAGPAAFDLFLSAAFVLRPTTFDVVLVQPTMTLPFEALTGVACAF